MHSFRYIESVAKEKSRQNKRGWLLPTLTLLNHLLIPTTPVNDKDENPWRFVTSHFSLKYLKESHKDFVKYKGESTSRGFTILNALHKYTKCGGAILWKYGLLPISYPIFYLRNFRKFTLEERVCALMLSLCLLGALAFFICPPIIACAGTVAIIPPITHALIAAYSFLFHPLVGSAAAYLFDILAIGFATVFTPSATLMVGSFLFNIPNIIIGGYKNVISFFNWITGGCCFGGNDSHDPTIDTVIMSTNHIHYALDNSPRRHSITPPPTQPSPLNDNDIGKNNIHTNTNHVGRPRVDSIVKTANSPNPSPNFSGRSLTGHSAPF